MASTSTKPTAADAPEYEPDRLYSVQLTEAVEHPPGSGQMFSPANPVQVKGKLAVAWGDKVSDAEPV